MPLEKAQIVEAIAEQAPMNGLCLVHGWGRHIMKTGGYGIT